MKQVFSIMYLWNFSQQYNLFLWLISSFSVILVGYHSFPYYDCIYTSFLYKTNGCNESSNYLSPCISRTCPYDHDCLFSTHVFLHLFTKAFILGYVDILLSVCSIIVLKCIYWRHRHPYLSKKWVVIGLHNDMSPVLHLALAFTEMLCYNKPTNITHFSTQQYNNHI